MYVKPLSRVGKVSVNELIQRVTVV